MKPRLLIALALGAAVSGSALAGPVAELAKKQIKRDLDDALDRADKAFPAKPDPMNPRPEPSSFKGRVEAALKDHFGPLVRQTSKGIKDSDGYKALSPHDSDLKVDTSPKGMPKVPSKCVEGSGCRDCFAQAQADLKHLRFSLEKLRAIGSWTDKFTKKSIAFGDSVSGVHGVAGLGWQPERAKIQESYDQFGKAYDAKYEELIGDLEGALREVGQCEAKHFSTPDWYDRYGFIYYTFMADRYRRAD
ncbi:MAG TPA: hypothetical protein VNA29_05550 [Sphingomicrobium sp.]|nr:hypothetical protein [Sphingomicrobium sp.]